MTTIITRLYDSQEKADKAVAALKAKKQRAEDIDFFAGSGALEAIKAAGVYPNAAAAYAQRLVDGGALVVCRAPFGNAVLAGRVLDGFGPVTGVVAHDAVYVETSAPLYASDPRPLPELLPEGTLILSDRLFPKAITRGVLHFSRFFGLPLLVGKAPSAGLLNDNPTPFSSALNMPLLSDREPKVSLLKNSRPFSDWLGLPTLIRT